ncbi:uncharacterized protein PV06_01015 [Exophiala oligosperma]|uniref:DUF1746 domain-containing protein n=2 Tax=Chaetothyriales TaxID=34395 RepID=A0A0D2CEY9_9EURO|nr:uncharacterized protein PV06_01015 [Exophiala oligosperma]KAJ9641156.1 hypothetical protein H2204_002834 [Knufia peltigerae]KIW48432.1 hypothetical protein PV06_01015 [Exophiala oligosperma]
MNNDSALNSERSLRVADSKNDYLRSLLRTLDAIIFIQIGITYLSDNLTLLLILRAISQVVHVQYRPTGLQLAPALFVSAVCFVSHLFWTRSGVKHTHGGLIIDFVGELPPSKLRLLLLDVVVLVMQLLMLVVGYQKQLALGHAQPQPDASPRQDIEAEEEGRLTSSVRESQADGEEEGIELQSLLPNGAEVEHGSSTPPRKPTTEEADLIVLDMKAGLTALFRKPLQPNSHAVEDPAMRAGLANVLSRVAAAHARAT